MKAPCNQSSNIFPVSTKPCPLSPVSFLTSPLLLESLSPSMELHSPSISIEEQIEQLDEEYTEIESLLLETIKHHSIPHKTMLKWIQILPMALKSQFSELLQRNAKALSNASSVDELYIIVSPYWNSLHPTLLEHLIKKLADGKLRSRMNKYTDKLRKFRVRTKLGDFIEKWVGGAPPGFDDFVVELGEEWRERTVEDLEQFRIRLCRQQCIGGHMTYMKKVIPGSVFVELALPHCRFPLVFDEVTQKFLREENVHGVYLNRQCILYLHHQVSHLQVSDEECKSIVEIEEMAVVGTTIWSDEELLEQSLSMNLYSYSYDTDAEYDEQEQKLTEEVDHEAGDNDFRTHDRCCIQFPSSSSLGLGFLYKSPDSVTAISPLAGVVPRFRMTPIRRTGEVELQLEMNVGDSPKDIEIGLEQCTGTLFSSEGEFSHAATDPLYESFCIFSVCGAVFNSLKRNMSMNINYPQGKLSLSQSVNRIGLKITRDGALEFFVNGQSQGIAAEAVYKLGRNMAYHPTTVYYPILWLPQGNNKAVIISGAAQTEVLSLQEICIDCVAEALNSPRHAHLLPLPCTLKEKVSKIVFDPDVDFCYDHFLQYRHDSNFDTVVHHAVYKNLISEVR